MKKEKTEAEQSKEAKTEQKGSEAEQKRKWQKNGHPCQIFMLSFFILLPLHLGNSNIFYYLHSNHIKN